MYVLKTCTASRLARLPDMAYSVKIRIIFGVWFGRRQKVYKKANLHKN